MAAPDMCTGASVRTPAQCAAIKQHIRVAQHDEVSPGIACLVTVSKTEHPMQLEGVHPQAVSNQENCQIERSFGGFPNPFAMFQWPWCNPVTGPFPTASDVAH